MKRRTKYIIQRVKQNISEIDPSAKVILFGSRARGDERKDSDWDILVLTSYPVDLEKERKFRNHIYDLELETGEPFSLFAYSESDWNSRQKITPFYVKVIKEGVEL
jgi:predicted nucleotidyltransferase